MKSKLKHYRIVTDNGDCLLIRRESLHCLLQSLERLASSGERARRVQASAPAQSKKMT